MMFLAPKLNIQIVTGKERSVATELTTAFNSKTYSVVKCFLQNYSGWGGINSTYSNILYYTNSSSTVDPNEKKFEG